MTFPVAARTLTLGLVLLVVPFLPACNLFFRVGFVIAERVLYLSSTGYCLLFAYAVGHCCCRWSKYRVGIHALRLWNLFLHLTWKPSTKTYLGKKIHENSNLSKFHWVPAAICSFTGSLSMETTGKIILV